MPTVKGTCLVLNHMWQVSSTTALLSLSSQMTAGTPLQEAADVPRRASLRQRGVKSSGMAVDYDLNGRFRVQYENGVRPEGAHLEEPEPEAPKERHPGG